MIIECPRCRERGLTYRYDEVYCYICSYRPYTVPKELLDYAKAEHTKQIKATRAWHNMRNKNKYAMKAVKVKVYDKYSSKYRYQIQHKKDGR